MCSKNYLPLSDEISKAFKIISTRRDGPLTLDAPRSIIRKWKKINDFTDCLATLSYPSLPNYFLTHKQFKHAINGLQRPASGIVIALSSLETLFMANYASFFPLSSLLSRFLQLSSSVHFPPTPCHPHLREFIFTSFFKIRIHHQCKLLTQSVKDNKHIFYCC